MQKVEGSNPFSRFREDLHPQAFSWLAVGRVRVRRPASAGRYARLVVEPPDSPMLSASQLAMLAELGDEQTADVGDVLYRVGDQRYPFIAILEGEVAIVDAAGDEIVRHGPSRFLGELNLLSGQSVFVTAVVAQP